MGINVLRRKERVNNMGFLDGLLRSVKREVERDVTRHAVDAAASSISNAINNSVNQHTANANTTTVRLKMRDIRAM